MPEDPSERVHLPVVAEERTCRGVIRIILANDGYAEFDLNDLNIAAMFPSVTLERRVKRRPEGEGFVYECPDRVLDDDGLAWCEFGPKNKDELIAALKADKIWDDYTHGFEADHCIASSLFDNPPLTEADGDLNPNEGSGGLSGGAEAQVPEEVSDN